MLKNSYVISGETLQIKIQEEISDMRHCFSKYKSEKSDFYYLLFKEHKAVLRMLFEIQGNSDEEIAMIMNYMNDPKR